MNTKLQELTDKIYNEGVEKGKTEAADIVAKAQTQAKDIIAVAQQEAERTIKEAQKKADELKSNTESELKLFAGQAMNALKTDITNMVCGDIVSDSIKAATADKSFMQEVIVKIAEQWAKDGHVEIEAKDAEALTNYFQTQAKTLLNGSVTITTTKGKSEFVIRPAEGGYKIAFGDEEFIAYFKEFLRPKLVEMLF